MKNRLFTRFIVVGIIGVCILGATGAGFLYVRSQESSGPPFAQTLSPTSVIDTVATLRGQVDPEGYQTTYWFEYGTTNALGTATSPQSAGSGSSYIDVSYTTYNLSSGTTYYVRIAAQNQRGTAYGNIITFSTSGYGTNGSSAVVTSQATNINGTSATFNGYVTATGTQGVAWFEYGIAAAGTTGSIGTFNRTPNISLGYQQSTSIQATVNNLTPGMTYYYRAAMQNVSGGTTVYGQTLNFVSSYNQGSYDNNVSYYPYQYSYPTYYQPYTYTSYVPQYQYQYVNTVPQYTYQDTSYPNNYYVQYMYPQSASVPVQYSYSYLPVTQSVAYSAQGTSYYPLAASIGTLGSSTQAPVIIGVMLLVILAVFLGVLVFKGV